MAAYSFLKEAKLYLVKGNQQFLLDISKVSFNQTFTENSYGVKNLHTPEIFEASVINRANPANFSFECFALKEDYNKVVFDSLVDYSTFDLYVETKQDVFKIENAVLTNGSFTYSRNKPLTISVSGEAVKVSRVGDYGNYTIPGTPVSKGTKTYLHPQDNSIVLDGLSISLDTLSVTLELQNEISWVPYNTVNSAVLNETMYPTDFVLETRILAGSIQRYVTGNTDTDLQTYSTSSSLRIKLGQNIGGTFYGFDFNIGTCSYTNRLNTGSVFTQNYDWRMTDNTTLSNIITYTTT
jgi:hypothetical protein